MKKTKAVLVGIVCLLAGLVIAQSTQPEIPQRIKDAKERYDKAIDIAEQAYVNAKSKALSTYYAQLDRAVKQEKDQEKAKQITDERAKIKDEMDKIENSKPAATKGLVGLKLVNIIDNSAFYLKKDGTFWHKTRKQSDFEEYGMWTTPQLCAIVKMDRGDTTIIFVENNKVYQELHNQFYQLKVE